MVEKLPPMRASSERAKTSMKKYHREGSTMKEGLLPAPAAIHSTTSDADTAAAAASSSSSSSSPDRDGDISMTVDGADDDDDDAPCRLGSEACSDGDGEDGAQGRGGSAGGAAAANKTKRRKVDTGDVPVGNQRGSEEEDGDGDGDGTSTAAPAPPAAQGASLAEEECRKLLLAPPPTPDALSPSDEGGRCAGRSAPCSSRRKADCGSSSNGSGLDLLRSVFEGIGGFRTSAVTSPRPALSIYVDSAPSSLSPSAEADGGSIGTKEESAAAAASGVAAKEEEGCAGREYLSAMLGLHPKQRELEEAYRRQHHAENGEDGPSSPPPPPSLRQLYCTGLFCARLREAMLCNEGSGSSGGEKSNDDDGDGNGDRPEEPTGDDFEEILRSSEESCRSSLRTCGGSDPKKEIAGSWIGSAVAKLVRAATTAAADRQDGNSSCARRLLFRPEQLWHEHERICASNSTLSNALLQKFAVRHRGSLPPIEEVTYRPSPSSPRHERITIRLLDDDEGSRSSDAPFYFVPCLRSLLARCDGGVGGGGGTLKAGPDRVASDMARALWPRILRRGYFCHPGLRAALTPRIEAYLRSGLAGGAAAADSSSAPIQLKAQFTPTYPLSLYFHGSAGTGKSSLVRHLPPALEEVIAEFVDPEITVRLVKQNLNKPIDVLQLELDLRPNNNDMSVMSIIQGRRMALSQTKPGLVFVALEEMPPYSDDSNPNQLETAELIRRRFDGKTGRNGSNDRYRGGRRCGNTNPQTTAMPAVKRGISGDASIVAVFTSNYALEHPSKHELAQLEMFSNLACVSFQAISGDDRAEFAKAYIQELVKSKCQVDLVTGAPVAGEGEDVRPLVRQLSMLAFYALSLLDEEGAAVRTHACIAATIINPAAGEKGYRISSGTSSMEVRIGPMGLLLPTTSRSFDFRVKIFMQILHTKTSLLSSVDEELSMIVDLWLAGSLAPAVVVSNQAEKIRQLISAISTLQGVHGIRDVNAGDYKMMKSLYDPNDTPNLRDDILLLVGRGSCSSTPPAFVAVELLCNTVDSQMCIREIVEDQPSITAFSTEKSALNKAGLFFCVYVKGDITPEILSRATLII